MKCPDVILVQPKLGEMDFLRTNPSLPLGLLSAATLISPKYKVKIIDQRISKNWKEILEANLNGGTLCVGVTSYTGTMIKCALEVCKFVRDISRAPIVWGGIHASLLPAQTLENKYVDVVVEGEGEYTLHDLLEAFSNDKPLAGVKGIWFKDGKKILRNSPRGFLDLNVLPDLPYHLVTAEDYVQLYRKRPSLPMETSRGCIYKCSYCYNTAYRSSTWRSLDTIGAVSRIKGLVNKYKVKGIYIIDDNFFVDLKRGEEFAKEIIKENLDVEWQVQGAGFLELQKMDKAYLELLEQSGCVRVTCGVESGSQRIRKILSKGSDLTKISRINRDMAGYNIIVLYSFISGFPGETTYDLRETIGFMFRLLKENPMARNTPIYQYVPYPQTSLFERVKREGYRIPDSLGKWQDYDFHNLNVEKLTYLDQGLRKIFKTEFLYFLPFFIDNKLNEYEAKIWIKIIVYLYRPIAWLRLKYLFFRFPVEVYIIKRFVRFKLFA